MKKQIIISSVILALLLSGCIIYSRISEPKFAYVLNGELYQDFDMKKQFEARISNVVQMRKTMIDSMTLQLNMRMQQWRAAAKKDSSEAIRIDGMRREILLKQQQFENDNQQMTEQYDQQIWKQLDQYVQDYSKAHGYTFVFGASGDGGIMYASDALNITADVKKYINQQFKTGK